MMAFQPAGKAGAQIVELALEDDLVDVRIGVEQARRERGFVQRLLDQRDDRRDAAAAGEQDGLPLPAAQDEAAAGRRHFDGFARFGDVVEPVRPDAAADPLDRDFHLGIAGRRARQRVAALDMAVFAGDPEGQELAGLVGEERRMPSGRPEPERPGARRLVNDLDYRERIEFHHRVTASGPPPASTPESGQDEPLAR